MNVKNTFTVLGNIQLSIIGITLHVILEVFGEVVIHCNKELSARKIRGIHLISSSLHLSSDLYKSLQSGSQAALPPHLQLAFSGNLHSSPHVVLPVSLSPSLHLSVSSRPVIPCSAAVLFVLKLSACFSVFCVWHASVDVAQWMHAVKLLFFQWFAEYPGRIYLCRWFFDTRAAV